MFTAKDWSAGILAYNVAASATSTDGDSATLTLFVLRTHAGRDACAPVAGG